MISKCACLAVAATVGLSAPAGAAITISTAGTQSMNCSEGICAPLATVAVLNVGDLESLLAAGDTTITTTNGAVQSESIKIGAGLTWASSNALKLDAYRSIDFENLVSISGTGGLILITDDGGENGTLYFRHKGRVQFRNLSSPFTFNGATYVLIDSIAALSSRVNSNPGGNFALADNYSAAGDGTYSTSPVTTTLAGTFEGLGNAITSLAVSAGNSQAYVGLFSEVSQTGSIEDLGLLKARVLSTCNAGGDICAVAGLVGYNSGILSKDSVTGKLHASGYAVDYNAGGLTGFNVGRIERCSSAMNVSAGMVNSLGGSNVGSLVGYSSGLVIGSSALGDVKFGDWGGGGGLMGQNDGTLSQSYAIGTVTCARHGCGLIGGLVGEQDGTVENSYSTGAVSGPSDDTGGLAGRAFTGSITNSYATGAVTGSYETGGFAGEVDDGTTGNGYWDTTTSGTEKGVGIGSSAGITGLTSEQLRSGLPNGFSAKIWAEDSNINNGFPYLANNPPPR